MTNSKHYAICINGLSRVYQSYVKPEGLRHSIRGLFNRQYLDKTALAPISLTIGAGEVLGLVGANGAGKTTLLKLLSGLIYPSAGDASVLGYSPWKRERGFLKRISILLGQKNQLWWDIAPADSFSLLAKIYDIDKTAARQRISQLADILGCQAQLTTQLRRLSLGERMKMEIIGCLLHRPDVIFLDEPTIGLDLMAQGAIRDFLKDYVTRFQPTIILTSHYMDDISKLANRLVLLSKGSIVFDGSIDTFTAKAQNLQKLSLGLERPPARDVELFKGLILAAGCKEFSAELPEKHVAEILHKIMQVSPVHHLKIEEADFEDDIRKFLQQESR